jgi:hypothetical protein
MGDLIPRVTLDAILGHRDAALAGYAEARDTHDEWKKRRNDMLTCARKAVDGACVGAASISVPDAAFKYLDEKREAYDREVRQALDRDIWKALLRLTGLASLMDHTAYKQFEAELASDPPEVTAETVRATFQQLKADAHNIFLRGLVKLFQGLDREYRSHDGFKIGSRIVSSWSLTEMGNLRDDTAAKLRDLERVFRVLDGKPIEEGWHCEITAPLYGVGNKWHGGQKWTPIPGEAETTYGKVKWYQNKNVHIFPSRPDLVRKMNRLIAEHFERGLGESPDTAGARRYTRATPHQHTVVDFYRTPDAVAAQMIGKVELHRGMEVLEPSAGDGQVVKALLAAGVVPDAVEIDPDRADTLRDLLPPGSVMNLDFLGMEPAPDYDAVFMNPPFGDGAGVQHVHHALRFVKPGGTLVAILGLGVTYRTDGPTEELRKLWRAWRGTVEVLPAGTFAESGTNVPAIILTITKPAIGLQLGRPAPWFRRQPAIAQEAAE